MYIDLGGEVPSDVNCFVPGDSIVYFRGNNTWRGEVVENTDSGYIVKDF